MDAEGVSTPSSGHKPIGGVEPKGPMSKFLQFYNNLEKEIAQVNERQRRQFVEEALAQRRNAGISRKDPTRPSSREHDSSSIEELPLIHTVLATPQ